MALEKLLKSRIVEVTNQPAPHSHDLLYLSGLANIELDIERQEFLAEVTTYNIEGRYPEEKLEFHKKVTKNLAGGQLQKISDFYLWLASK